MRSIFHLLPLQRLSGIALKESFSKAEHIVRFYYISLLYLAIERAVQWSDFLGKKDIEPLWPVAWFRFVDYQVGVNIIFTLLLISAFLAAIFPKMRLARILAFFSFLESISLVNSFGKINHGEHIWLLTSFLLIFLPNKSSPEKPYYRKFLYIFWGCQAIVLLTYTMSGIFKVYGAFHQMSLGQIHAFHPQAMSLQVANRLLQTGSTSVLGSWIIDQIWLGWILYVSAIFIEFFAFFVVFRPSLHRLWAFAIISMHIGIGLTMAIPFKKNILLLAILFFNSPFIVSGNRWQRSLYDLPIIGLFIRKLYKRKSHEKLRGRYP